MIELTGKTALVTGASRGIGRATAQALAKAGARVLVHYGKGEAAADAVVAGIRDAGGSAEKVGADLEAPKGAHALAEKVRGLVVDRLDILVANAGVGKDVALEDTTLEDFDRLFAVNVRAPFFLVQQLLPVLGLGSSVILVSSLAARASVGPLPAYAASKGAVETLVPHLAWALGGHGIRVNAVAPGVTATEMAAFTQTEEGQKFVFGMQALQRIGQPEDVADVIVLLASDEARWITGDTIRADGGAKL